MKTWLLTLIVFFINILELLELIKSNANCNFDTSLACNNVIFYITQINELKSKQKTLKNVSIKVPAVGQEGYMPLMN